MVSAFLNTVKIPELRRRILFTLAIIVVVRLGAAITTPGVNQAVLQEWFRTSLTQRTGGGLAALFNLFSGGALENCAVFSLGIMPYISASIMMQLLTAVIPQLGRLAREDGGRQKIMQLTRYTTVGLCIFQGYLLALSFQHPESYHTMLPGITDTIRNLGISNRNSDIPDDRHSFADVAGRSNHRAGYWQRDIPDHHDWNCRALAGRARAGMEDLCAFCANWIKPGKSDGPCIASVVLDHRHCRGDHDHARGTKDHRSVCQAGGGPQNVRRPDAIHAFESELRRCDADHLCLGTTSLSSDDCSVRVSKQPYSRADRQRAFHGLASLCCSGGNDFLFQLFLGCHTVSTDSNRGRSKEIRWLLSWRPAGKTDCRLS